MKIVPAVAGLLLAGSFAMTAQAGPSKGEILTYCKSEINDTFTDVDRIRTAKYKYRAVGTTVTFKVSTGGEIEKVTCTYKNGVTSLTNANGEFIAKAGSDSTVES